MKVVKFKEDKSVQEAMDNFMKDAEYDGVLLFGLTKDGGQRMRSSNMSGMQKAFLIQFAQAWMNSWFELRAGDE